MNRDSYLIKTEFLGIGLYLVKTYNILGLKLIYKMLSLEIYIINKNNLKRLIKFLFYIPNITYYIIIKLLAFRLKRFILLN